MILQQRSGKIAPMGSMLNMISVQICLGNNTLYFCVMIYNGHKKIGCNSLSVQSPEELFDMLAFMLT